MIAAAFAAPGTYAMSQVLLSSDVLARLSLSAAYEIDLKLYGSDSSHPSALRQLGEQLTRVSGSDAGLSTAFMRADPMTTEALARVLEEANETPINDIDGLASEMRKLIAPIADESGHPTSEQLLTVKSFCLALHRSMMAQSMPPLQEWDPTDSEISLA